MKYFESTYWVMMSIALVNWLTSAVEISSKIAALLIAVMTVLYLIEKYKGQKIDNKIKRKELNNTKDGSE